MQRSVSAVGLALLVVLLAGCNLLDWPQYGGNGANSGTAGLTPLNTHNVGSLKQAWVAPSPNWDPADLAVVGDTVYASSPVNTNQVITDAEASPPGASLPLTGLEAHSVADGSLRWSDGSASLTIGGPSSTICVNVTAGTAPVVPNGQYDFLSQSTQCAPPPGASKGAVISCSDAPVDATSGTPATVTSSPDGCISSDPVAANDGTVYVVRTPLLPNTQGPNGPGPAVVGSDGSVFIAPGTNASGVQLSNPTVDGNSLFVETSTGQLVAFDRTTHQMLWSQPTGATDTLPTGGPPPTPSVANGRVFVAVGGVNVGGPNTQAFDATTGQPLWSAALPETPTTTAPAATGTAVFVRTGTTLLALDAASGATLWQASLGGFGVEQLGSASVANNVVFVGTTCGSVCSGQQDGRLLAFDASNGTPIWSATLSGSTASPLQPALGSRPVVSGDAVYISATNGTAGSNLYKFSLSGH